MSAHNYVGNELELFERATNWKAYYAGFLRRYLAGDVLEVGAGIGATTRALCDGSQNRWLCLEPDFELSAVVQSAIVACRLPKPCMAIRGFVGDLSSDDKFDAIVYIDVLEHIDDDHKELAAAVRHLKKGGVLIVLGPAHQWLYTAFDLAIGHHRRYNRKSLSASIPSGFQCLELRYLDSLGLLASIANKLILKSSLPRPRQIEIWDKLLVPLSRLSDRFLGYRLGKSIVGVWSRND